MTRPEVGDDGSQIPAPRRPRSLVASISPAVVASVVEAVQPLSRSVLGARDWQREFMPEVPDLAATFTPAGYDFVARDHQLLGIDSIVAATSLVQAVVYLGQSVVIRTGHRPGRWSSEMRIALRVCGCRFSVGAASTSER